jgi:hypothetical protein
MDDQSSLLEKKHAVFCLHEEQLETWEQKIMATHGHPHAQSYRFYRAFFDNLKYAGSADTRFYSYQDDLNFTEYSRPRMAVNTYSITSWGATPNKALMDYLLKVAAAGWPDDAEPVINSGQFTVHTTNEEFRAALHAHDRGRKRSWNEPGGRVFSLEPGDEADFEDMRLLIDTFHAGYVLPTRKGDSDAAIALSRLSLAAAIALFPADLHDAWI